MTVNKKKKNRPPRILLTKTGRKYIKIGKRRLYLRIEPGISQKQLVRVVINNFEKRRKKKKRQKKEKDELTPRSELIDDVGNKVDYLNFLKKSILNENDDLKRDKKLKEEKEKKEKEERDNAERRLVLRGFPQPLPADDLQPGDDFQPQDDLPPLEKPIKNEDEKGEFIKVRKKVVSKAIKELRSARKKKKINKKEKEEKDKIEYLRQRVDDARNLFTNNAIVNNNDNYKNVIVNKRKYIGIVGTDDYFTRAQIIKKMKPIIFFVIILILL